MRSFPDERSRNLLVRDGVLMIGLVAPFRRRCSRQRDAAPWRIANYQIDIYGVSAVIREEIAAPNTSFNISIGSIRRVVDQRRQSVAFFLQLLNIPWTKLIEISQIKAKCRNPACCRIDIDPIQTAKNLTKLPCALVVPGPGVCQPPLFRHAIK